MDLRALVRRLQQVVTRGRITRTDPSGPWCQVETPGGDVLESIEALTPYGFASVPSPGAEALVLAPGGGRDGAFVIACGDRRYRLEGLAQGEVAMHSDEGDAIVLRRGNRIEIKTKSFGVKSDIFNVDAKKVSLGGGGGELVSLLAQALESIARSTVQVPGGPQPLTPATAELLPLIAKLKALQEAP
jgi:phage baseplate assembly protein V